MTAAIILAAGSSSRLGTPKQLLQYKGRSLLQIAMDAALSSICERVVVVTGANAREMEAMLDKTNVERVHNANWKGGMSTSIKAGLQYVLQQGKRPDNVIIMLCDQPFADASLLSKLLAKHIACGKHIIACAYKNTLGVPALFAEKFFDSLLQLQGDEGAKKIVMAHRDDVAQVDFEKGVFDIDTIEDLRKLQVGI